MPVVTAAYEPSCSWQTVCVDVGPGVRSLLVALVLTGLIVVGLAPPASACSCSAAELTEYADDVAFAFVGQQTSREVVDEVLDNGAVLTFDVNLVFKGVVAETVTVRTNAQGSACGMDFSTLGATGVAVFMWRGQPSVSLCGSAVTADELKAVFGPGVLPSEAIQTGPDQHDDDVEVLAESTPLGRAGFSVWYVVVLSGLVAAVVAAAVLTTWRYLRS